MKINIWCESGANSVSCNRQEIDIDELGYTEEEWRELSDDARWKAVYEWFCGNGLEIGWDYTDETEK